MAEWTPPSIGNAIWFDIPAVDVAGCKAFYAAVFPTWTWRPATAQQPEDKAAMFTMGSDVGALNGGISKVDAEAKKSSLELGVGVTLYYLVASLDETQIKIEQFGGSIVKEKTKEAGSGWVLIAKDCEGNRFGAHQF